MLQERSYMRKYKNMISVECPRIACTDVDVSGDVSELAP
jgi:hypothetical protein